MKPEESEAVRLGIIEVCEQNDRNGVWSDADSRAEGWEPLTIEKLKDTIVGWAKDEILADVASGRVPETVTSFSQLHDYVDANGYGLMFDIWDAVSKRHSEPTEILCDFTNSVQDELHAWLESGGISSARKGAC